MKVVSVFKKFLAHKFIHSQYTRLDMLQVIKFCKPVCVFTLPLFNDAAIKTAERRMTG